MIVTLSNYLQTRFTTLLLVVCTLNIIIVACLYFSNLFNGYSAGELPLFKINNMLAENCLKRNTCAMTMAEKIKTFFINKFMRHEIKWNELPDKFEMLELNPIYKKFNIKKPLPRPSVDVVFIVSSAPARVDRRMGIRGTWWPDCKTSERVSIICVFLTDEKDKSTAVGKKLLAESDRYGDLRFQKLEGGFDFGKRFLYHMLWAMTNYKFKYFLRLDDDYFLCMKRFLHELPMPPPPLYHWGWVHCVQDIVRPEESIILLSKDLVELYLGQDPDTMQCHRWADQMLGVWKEELNISTLYYHHDIRLHHHPPAQYVEEFKTRRNICDDFIGVHGSYPIQMKVLWQHRGKEILKPHDTFANFSARCQLPNIMKYQNFFKEFFAEPKLCKSNPDWGGGHGSTYIGRQGSR